MHGGRDYDVPRLSAVLAHGREIPDGGLRAVAPILNHVSVGIGGVERLRRGGQCASEAQQRRADEERKKISVHTIYYFDF